MATTTSDDFSDTDSLLEFLPSFKRRGTPGVAGDQFKVITNSFHVKGPMRAEMHFFDVNIPDNSADETTSQVSTGSGGKAGRVAPQNPHVRRQQNRRIINKVVAHLQEQFGWQKLPLFAYDEEKTLALVNVENFKMDRRDKKEVSVTLQNAGAEQRFLVTLTYTKALMITGADFTPRASEQDSKENTRSQIERLQALNLVLREGLLDVTLAKQSNKDSIVVALGDKVFANVTTENFRNENGFWRSIWPGFTAALRVTRAGLVLMADQTFSVFFSENFMDKAVAAVLNVPQGHVPDFELFKPSPRDEDRRQPNHSRELMDLTAIFRSKTVEFQAADGEDISDGVMGMFLASAEKMPTEKGGQETVADCYARHGIKLTYPRMPVVEVRSGPRVFRVPVEKCYILGGQRYSKPLTKPEQATFIRTVGKSPDVRIRNIDSFLDFTRIREHPLLKAIGLGIEKDFMKIDARQLPLPGVEYGSRNAGGREVVMPRDGSWVTPRNALFKVKGEMGKFLVFCFPAFRGGQPCLDQNAAQNFINELKREATNRGMQMDNLIRYVNLREERQERYEAQMLPEIQRGNPAFVFGIMEKNMESAYAAFKTVMDCKEGIPSQGLCNQTVMRNPRGCVENICQKINIKCGGVNNVLTDDILAQQRLLQRCFMVVGISLSHGSTKSTTARPSYASFVASMDDSFEQWQTETKVIQTNEAVLTDFSEEMGRLLDGFNQHCGQFPDTVIVYRDGVTRTHENKVLKSDIKCIEGTFVKRGLTGKTKLVFVVVNKMHRTRFFRVPQADNMGAVQYSRDNIPAGLVVDSQVVDPFNDDFYLASHRGALGTSRPIRYHILVNEQPGTNADDIQKLTMNLCYIYQRCTTGVSIPAPLYYANLAAGRCSVLAEDTVKRLDDEANRAELAAGGDSGNRDRGRGRGGPRGGRGGGRGRGRGAGFSMGNSDAVRRLQVAIAQNPRLKELKRLSYI